MTDAVLDRNLLFGALALQDYLIDAQQLGEICVVWATKMQQPMPDLLRERGWITAEDQKQIEKRMERIIKRHGGDIKASLGAVAGAEARDAIRQADAPEIRKSLSGLPPAAGYVLLETMAPPVEQNRTRYTLSRLHAEGGLGKVWLARDNDLNREVALKEIQPDHAAHPEAWRRFLKEAQVTGQLEHPNIIPVYELSRRPEDDQPFYTMRFARGRTMRQTIAEYHENRAKGQVDPLVLPRLLQAFVNICQAIGYAHTRGVIHRDLKPENVVLGAFGEVLVLDWGLAKVSDQPDEPETSKSVELSADARVGATRAGSQLGTPSYMAPEQAEGRLDLIDARTDIYGLGGILFEILTGRPPHQGKSTLEVLDTIVSGTTPHPKTMDPSVPAALDAVCAKALAKARNERYKKATDLAEEVQRWLADEPVSVYRDPWTTRFARWGRRHKRVASGLAVFLISSATALGLVAYFVNRERAKTETQRQLAVENGEKAIENFRLANEAADSMLLEVGDVELADIPQMEAVRRRLLTKAKKSYEKFLEQKGDEPVVRWGAGRAEGRLGNVLDMLGESTPSAAAYGRAIEILTPLTEQAPDEADYRRDLAYAYNGRGILRKKLNRFRDAEADLTTAIKLRKALAEASPSNADDQQALANSRYQLGAVLARVSGRRKEQEDSYREALEAQTQLVASQRDRPEFRATLGRYLNNLAMLLASDRKADAEKTFREALDIEETLVKQSPTLPGPRWQLARAANNLGALISSNTVRADESRKLYRRAQELLEALAAEFPNIPQYRRELASVYYNLGLTDQKGGHLPEAQAQYQKAVDLFAALSRDNPDVAEYKQKTTAATVRLDVLLARSNPQEADRLVQEALDGEEALVAKFPEVAEYADVLGRDYYSMARSLITRKDAIRACQFIERAIQHHRSALRALTSDQSVRERLAEDLYVWASALLARGDHAAAANAAEELAQLVPDDLPHQLAAAAFLVQCSAAVMKDSQVSEPQRPELAAAYEGRAVQVIKDAVGHKVIQSVGQLESPDLAPLKKRDDFKKLQESLKPQPATRIG